MERRKFAYRYRYNKSYIKNGNGIEEVCWGTRDSVRLDFYNEITKHCVDIKNYTVTTQSGRDSLVRNVVDQYNKRVLIFPNDTSFEVVIDVRGQAWTQEMLDDIIHRIIEQTNGNMTVSFMN